MKTLPGAFTQGSLSRAQTTDLKPEKDIELCVKCKILTLNVEAIGSTSNYNKNELCTHSQPLTVDTLLHLKSQRIEGWPHSGQRSRVRAAGMSHLRNSE